MEDLLYFLFIQKLLIQTSNVKTLFYSVRKRVVNQMDNVSVVLWHVIGQPGNKQIK